MFEIFDPEKDFEVAEDASITKDTNSMNRIVASVNIYLQTAYDHFLTTREILKIGNGIESSWDVKFTRHYISESRLSTDFKDFKDVKEIAIDASMIEF